MNIIIIIDVRNDLSGQQVSDNANLTVTDLMVSVDYVSYTCIASNDLLGVTYTLQRNVTFKAGMCFILCFFHSLTIKLPMYPLTC
jgi:hypothetical protein